MAVQETKYEVSRAKAIFILLILTLLYMMAYMDRSVMTVVVEQLKADIGLTDGRIGFQQTTFMVGACGTMPQTARALSMRCWRKNSTHPFDQIQPHLTLGIRRLHALTSDQAVLL